MPTKQDNNDILTTPPPMLEEAILQNCINFLHTTFSTKLLAPTYNVTVENQGFVV